MLPNHGQHSGYSLHRSRRVGHEEREDLEQIARCILRNPFSTAKMHFEPGAGQCPLPLTHEQEAGRQLRGALAHRLHNVRQCQ